MRHATVYEQLAAETIRQIFSACASVEKGFLRVHLLCAGTVDEEAVVVTTQRDSTRQYQKIENKTVNSSPPPQPLSRGVGLVPHAPLTGVLILSRTILLFLIVNIKENPQNFIACSEKLAEINICSELLGVPVASCTPQTLRFTGAVREKHTHNK